MAPRQALALLGTEVFWSCPDRKLWVRLLENSWLSIINSLRIRCNNINHSELIGY